MAAALAIHRYDAAATVNLRFAFAVQKLLPSSVVLYQVVVTEVAVVVVTVVVGVELVVARAEVAETYGMGSLLHLDVQTPYLHWEYVETLHKSCHQY